MLNNREELRRYAWDYFAVHAAQRMTAFNFYIVISTVIGTGILSSLNKKCPFYLGALILGFVLSYLSFVFYRLEERTRQLIKNGEAALKQLDDTHGDMEKVLKLFHEDEEKLEKIRKKLFGKISWLHYSYTDCFRAVFLLFGTIGIAISIYSFLKIIPN